MARTFTFLPLCIAVALSTAAFGQETQWQKDHPRRAEVNGRLNNQNRRIQEGEKSGKLTKEQGRELHQEDKAIRKEERQDAAKNGGHITKAEKRQLNRQENKVSKQIHAEKHPRK